MTVEEKSQAQMQRRLARSQFKLNIILPIVYSTYSDKSATKYAERICNETETWPDGEPFRYTPKTILTWARNYKAKAKEEEQTCNIGLAQSYLLGKERSDKGESRKLSSEARARIASLLAEFPGIVNGAAIHRFLIKEKLITEDVSVRTVQRYLQAQELTRGRDLTAEDRKKFECAYFGEVWQADTKHTLVITENGVSRKTYLQQIVDDHSRLIVGGGFFYADTGVNFESVFKTSVKNFGAPNLLYSDHGGPYENNQLNWICDSIGTVLKHPRARDGASKGKIEKMWVTTENYLLNWIHSGEISSIAQLNNMYNEFVNMYNNTIHSSIKCTPYERYRESKSVARHLEPEMIDLCFFHRIYRLVRADNTVKIQNEYYDVPRGFAGRKVEVRHLPGTYDGAFVYHNEQKYPIVRTDLVKNAHTKRTQRGPFVRESEQKRGVDYSQLAAKAKEEQSAGCAEGTFPSPFAALAEELKGEN